MDESNIKRKIDSFNWEVSELIDNCDLPMESIVDLLILQAVLLSLDNYPDELSGMRSIHSSIEDSIKFYQKYYS